MDPMTNKLKVFLQSKMKMSRPYQPVIIKCFLENDGQASLEKGTYKLAVDINLNPEERLELIGLASEKTEEFYTTHPYSDFARHGWGNLRHKMIAYSARWKNPGLNLKMTTFS